MIIDHGRSRNSNTVSQGKVENWTVDVSYFNISFRFKIILIIDNIYIYIYFINVDKYSSYQIMVIDHGIDLIIIIHKYAFRRKLESISTRFRNTETSLVFPRFSWMRTLLWCCRHRNIFEFCIKVLAKEFETRFNDFSKIGKLYQFLRTPYDVLSERE